MRDVERAMRARAADLVKGTPRRKTTMNTTINQNATNKNVMNSGDSVVTNPSAPTITTVTNTRVSVEARYQTLVAGILANLAGELSLSIGGGTYALADLVARFQGAIAAEEKAKASQNQWHMDVQSARQIEAALSPLFKGMQRYVQGRYGEDNAKLAEFGFAPTKPRKTTTKAKAAAAVKAQATRKARNTVGKNQRKAITAPPATSPVASPQPATPQPAAPPAVPQPATPSAAPPATTPATGAHPTTGGAS
jgi:hypothetical protein